MFAKDGFSIHATSMQHNLQVRGQHKKRLLIEKRLVLILDIDHTILQATPDKVSVRSQREAAQGANPRRGA